MKEGEKQLNIDVDADLHKQIKVAADNEGMRIKEWVKHACLLLLNFDSVATEHCQGLGWSPPPATKKDSKAKKDSPVDLVEDIIDS